MRIRPAATAAAAGLRSPRGPRGRSYQRLTTWANELGRLDCLHFSIPRSQLESMRATMPTRPAPSISANAPLCQRAVGEFVVEPPRAGICESRFVSPKKKKEANEPTAYILLYTKARNILTSLTIQSTAGKTKCIQRAISDPILDP